MTFVLRRVFPLILAMLPFAGLAEVNQSQFALRALGVKVGEMALSSDINQTRYAVTGRLGTTGLAGTIKRVRFILEVTGRRKGAQFQPKRYVEDMDTGQRESRVRLDYSRGIARASGPKVGEVSDHSVTDAQQRGAVDPLTAIFMVLRDQREAELCTLRQKIFDGERLTEIALTRRSNSGDMVQCSGYFTRLAGYPPGDLRQGSRFTVLVTYARSGDIMRAMRVEAKTIYGPAVVVRK